MSDPLAERLSRFTPDAAGLDRDALLFAAGRASVRPRRAWPVLAGALALGQALTLALLWPKPTPAGGDGAEPSPPAFLEPSSPSPAAPEAWALSRRLPADSEEELPLPSFADASADDPPLRAFALPTSLTE